jgi:hypothetical protein
MCRVLNAYFDHPPDKRPIDRMLRVATKGADVPVQLADIGDVQSEEKQRMCRRLLHSAVTFGGNDANRDMVSRQFFFDLMSHRMAFYDSLFYTFNTSVVGLGSNMLEIFLAECRFLCTAGLNCSWEDCQTPLFAANLDGSFLPLPPHGDFNQLSPKLQGVFKDGIQQLREYERSGRNFVEYLAHIFNIHPRLIEKICAAKQFVLTSDFFFKLFLIHQRKLAQLPVILSGETGVGKTFLLEFYALLLYEQAQNDRNSSDAPFLSSKFADWLLKNLLSLPSVQPHFAPPDLEEIRRNLAADSLSENQLIDLWSRMLRSLPDDMPPDSHPLALLVGFIETTKEKFKLLAEIPDEMEKLLQAEITIESSAEILKKFFHLPLIPLFHRILIHPDISSESLQSFLDDIIDTAEELEDITQVVFLDEVNTSSCLGTIKEIVMDRTFNGSLIPRNIFFVCAINPYRGEKAVQKLITATTSSFDIQHSDGYFVHPLPKSMESLIWHFHGMKPHMLRDYIRRKIELSKGIYSLDDYQVNQCVEFILTAQTYCAERLGISSVSQRDVQRAFILLRYFKKLFHSEPDPRALFTKSVFLSIALVYYLRLPVTKQGQSPTRRDFADQSIFADMDFEAIVVSSIDSFITPENFEVPEGIALNQALKENIFATVACVASGVPIGIFGAPGSSKTLSFQIIRDNLKGKSSPRRFCQQFPALDCFFYQCSEFSTAAEITGVFERAITRQKQFDRSETLVVVFLDEASLPKTDLGRMALKSLHPFLDDCKVSFICISK